MADFKKINEMLEKVGSPYRAYSGGVALEPLAAVLEAMPAYIEKVIEEKMKAYRQNANS